MKSSFISWTQIRGSIKKHSSVAILSKKWSSCNEHPFYYLHFYYYICTAQSHSVYPSGYIYTHCAWLPIYQKRRHTWWTGKCCKLWITSSKDSWTFTIGWPWLCAVQMALEGRLEVANCAMLAYIKLFVILHIEEKVSFAEITNITTFNVHILELCEIVTSYHLVKAVNSSSSLLTALQKSYSWILGESHTSALPSNSHTSSKGVILSHSANMSMHIITDLVISFYMQSTAKHHNTSRYTSKYWRFSPKT